MRRRSGKFWDGVEGRAPKPRAAATMGWGSRKVGFRCMGFSKTEGTTRKGQSSYYTLALSRLLLGVCSTGS
jgi:hypothetical protein